MIEYKINENQLNSIWNVISELPVNKVINVVDMIRSLPKIQNENKDPN